MGGLQRKLPLLSVLAVLGTAVTCCILVALYSPVKMHEISLFARNTRGHVKSPRMKAPHSTIHAQTLLRSVQNKVDAPTLSVIKKAGPTKMKSIKTSVQSLDDAAAPADDAAAPVVRDPRYPAVLYGDAEAMKELDEIRANATSAFSNLPDGASPIVKALAVQDYEEVKRLLDEISASATGNVATKAGALSSKLSLSTYSSAKMPKLQQSLQQILVDIEGGEVRKGSVVDREDRVLEAMSATRNALAELLSQPAVLSGLEADEAPESPAQREAAYTAVKSHIPGGAASLQGAESGLVATASDVALPAHSDGKGGTWYAAAAEKVDGSAYVVNQPVTTFVTDGRVPYEALPQTVESSA